MKSIAVVLTGLAVLAAAEQTNKRASATDPTPPTLEQLCVGFTNDDTCQREAHICLTKTGVKRGKDFWEKISTCLEGRHPPPLDQLCAGFTDRNVCQRATQECADEIGENDWVKITTCLEGKPHGLATFDRGVRIKDNLKDLLPLIGVRIKDNPKDLLPLIGVRIKDNLKDLLPLIGVRIKDNPKDLLPLIGVRIKDNLKDLLPLIGVRIKENLLSPKTVAEFYARTGFNDSDCRRHLNDCL
ncbi:hypothetical protein BM221_002427 [Beauveria bassiana]|uniref:Secreted protein n=1 Tax=Beauveria bassiana TaxID=176275 RepID=A0A2N6NYH2_BEABA|nr:hypothetical protein BM221_002427 [Beauveria bassiana]